MVTLVCFLAGAFVALGILYAFAMEDPDEQKKREDFDAWS